MYLITITKQDGTNFPNGQSKIIYKSKTRSMPTMGSLPRKLVKAIEISMGNNNWEEVYVWSRQPIETRLMCLRYYRRVDGRDKTIKNIDYFSADDLAARVLGDKFVDIYCE